MTSGVSGASPILFTFSEVATVDRAGTPQEQPSPAPTYVVAPRPQRMYTVLGQRVESDSEFPNLQGRASPATVLVAGNGDSAAAANLTHSTSPLSPPTLVPTPQGSASPANALVVGDGDSAAAANLTHSTSPLSPPTLVPTPQGSASPANALVAGNGDSAAAANLTHSTSPLEAAVSVDTPPPLKHLQESTRPSPPIFFPAEGRDSPAKENPNTAPLLFSPSKPLAGSVRSTQRVVRPVARAASKASIVPRLNLGPNIPPLQVVVQPPAPAAPAPTNAQSSLHNASKSGGSLMPPQNPPSDLLHHTARGQISNLSRPPAPDFLQSVATGCEENGLLGTFCGTCVIRPLWGSFRIATHALGGALSTASSLACCATSLTCRTINICYCGSDQPKHYGQELAGVAEKNFNGALIAVDSIRNRVWEGANILWQPLGEAVCCGPCAQTCPNAMTNCSIKTALCYDKYCIRSCTRIPSSPGQNTYLWWMNSKCMNALKWLNGSDRFFQNIAYVGSHKILAPQENQSAKTAAGTLTAPSAPFMARNDTAAAPKPKPNQTH